MNAPTLFDRTLLKQRQQRALRQHGSVDFLWQHMANRLVDRLADTTRQFPSILNLGNYDGNLQQQLLGQHGCEQFVGAADISLDEEWLPFAPASFDLVLSVGSLHLVNDLPGVLAQIRRILKPGGLFLASFPGGRSLHELRDAFMQAEMHITGGISPRVAPFVDAQMASQLLQRTGFELPVADSDTVMLSYASPLALMHELRAMGQSNVMTERSRSPLRREMLNEMEKSYQQHHREPEGRIRATIECITMTGWG